MSTKEPLSPLTATEQVKNLAVEVQKVERAIRTALESGTAKIHVHHSGQLNGGGTVVGFGPISLDIWIEADVGYRDADGDPEMLNLHGLVSTDGDGLRFIPDPLPKLEDPSHTCDDCTRLTPESEMRGWSYSVDDSEGYGDYHEEVFCKECYTNRYEAWTEALLREQMKKGSLL